MKVQYLYSASVLVEHSGQRILCDPWFSEGIYHGSWFHYPPLPFGPQEFTDVDYLYISHIHPDHVDAETLKHFPREIPILIHEFAEKYLLKLLQRLGFKEIREIPHKGTVQLGPDLTLEILSADNCDPAVCGRFFGCVFPGSYQLTQQIDSLAIFHGGGKTVVNANDCPYALAHSICDYIRSKYPTIDFAMIGYGGAGEYPQCFEDMDEPTRLENAQRKRQQMLHQAVQYLRHLQPNSFMPFAGLYLLGGKWADRNRFRGIPELEELPEAFKALLPKNEPVSKMVLLNSGEWFDVDRSEASAPFVPPDPVQRARYLETTLSNKKYDYETTYHVPEKDQVDLTPKLREAHTRMVRYQQLCGYRSSWKVYLDTGQERLYSIPYDGSPVTQATRGSQQEPYVQIQLDYSLLNMILNRKAYWNNAVIGSHLTFSRKPEVFERAVYQVLCYLC